MGDWEILLMEFISDLRMQLRRLRERGRLILAMARLRRFWAMWGWLLELELRGTSFLIRASLPRLVLRMGKGSCMTPRTPSSIAIEPLAGQSLGSGRGPSTTLMKRSGSNPTTLKPFSDEQNLMARWNIKCFMWYVFITVAFVWTNDKYHQLERWADSVRDYEVLKNELPGDAKVAEALLHAQISLKTFRGIDMSSLKLGGQIESITGLDQFHTAITSPGKLSKLLLVYFCASLISWTMHCSKIFPNWFADSKFNIASYLKFHYQLILW